VLLDWLLGGRPDGGPALAPLADRAPHVDVVVCTGYPDRATPGAMALGAALVVPKVIRLSGDLAPVLRSRAAGSGRRPAG
jgi:hypothetical protein